jgi:hypothetical protein
MTAVDMQTARPALQTLTTAPVPRRPPAELPEGFWYTVKRRVLGPPLVTEQLKNLPSPRHARPITLRCIVIGRPHGRTRGPPGVPS